MTEKIRPIDDTDRDNALAALRGMLWERGFFGRELHEELNRKLPNGDLVWFAIYKHFRDGKNVGHRYDALDIEEAIERARTCADPTQWVVSLTGMRPVNKEK